MVVTKDSNIKIGVLERIIVNWALPSDFIYHSICALATHDDSQTPYERLHAMWHGKIDKYHKLLVIKQNHSGNIPERVQNICRETPCGYTRLLLAYFR